MIIDARRLLGFAFAGADLLLELDEDGKIAFALGATQAMLGIGDDAATGRVWLDLVTPADRPLVEALMEGLADGGRCGPVPIRVLQGSTTPLAFTARRLTANGDRISCALRPSAVGDKVAGSDDGLFPREDFDDVARRLFESSHAAGLDLELAMVEMTGLGAARQALAPLAREALDLRIAGVLRAQSHGGTAAARLGEERFALLRAKDGGGADLAGRVSRAVSKQGVAALDTTTHALSLAGEGSSARVMRAMRSALDDFSREGFSVTPPLTLSDAMSQSVRRTLAQAGELGVAVSQRRFTLAYQPVVSLKTGEAHHYEALLRFEGGGSPQAQVRMAEEFDLIEELDHAVAEQVAARLQADKTGSLKLAANISGRTIVSEPFIALVERLLKKNDKARGRLIFEVTETAAIDDLALAERHIQALRKMGSMVCLDDFGSGAASLAYLQRMSFDIVKIDGRYIRELLSSSRDGALVRHVVGLCAELKVRTVAEMVETAEVEEIVRKAGVDFAQGWLYGHPSAQPERPAGQKPAVPVRRRGGTVESWG